MGRAASLHLPRSWSPSVISTAKGPICQGSQTTARSPNRCPVVARPGLWAPRSDVGLSEDSRNPEQRLAMRRGGDEGLHRLLARSSSIILHTVVHGVSVGEDRADSAATLRRLNITAGVGLIITYVYGVYDGVRGYGRPRRERALAAYATSTNTTTTFGVSLTF